MEMKKRRVISEVYQLVLKKDMQCHKSFQHSSPGVRSFISSNFVDNFCLTLNA